MGETPPIPRRAFRLELKVEADSRKELIGFLRSFETSLHMDQVSTGATGGYSSGAIYSLDVDETITHDDWARVNEAYVRWLGELDK